MQYISLPDTIWDIAPSAVKGKNHASYIKHVGRLVNRKYVLNYLLYNFIYIYIYYKRWQYYDTILFLVSPLKTIPHVNIKMFLLSSQIT